MAYSTSLPPQLVTPSFTNTTGEVGQWNYWSSDASTAVDATGYITNAKALGMKVGDFVTVTDIDSSPVLVTIHRVIAINTDGSGDLSDGTAHLTSTNSD